MSKEAGGEYPVSSIQYLVFSMEKFMRYFDEPFKFSSKCHIGDENNWRNWN